MNKIKLFIDSMRWVIIRKLIGKEPFMTNLVINGAAIKEGCTFYSPINVEKSVLQKEK